MDHWFGHFWEREGIIRLDITVHFGFFVSNCASFVCYILGRLR